MRASTLLRALAAVFAAALLAAACGGAAVPDPPEEYTASMAGLEAAVAGRDPYGIEFYAFEVSESLLVFRDTPGVPIPMRADLDRLAYEVASFGARGGAADSKEWIDLHSRIGRVTSGLAPTEGPRYQSEFPPAVVEAVETIDESLSVGDVATAHDVLWTLTGAFWQWLDNAPPQVVQNAYEVAEQLDSLAYSADVLSAEELRTQWESIRSRLRI